MELLMNKIRRVAAESLGCGNCTMLAGWRTASVQKPRKCAISEYYICCPITGEMPQDWEEVERKVRYVFVDSEVDE